MEHFKDLLPQAVRQIETSAQQTKVPSATTAELAKSSPNFGWEFEIFGDPQLRKMKDAAVHFCAAMHAGDRPFWLSLLGTSGAGKTHLARRISRFFQLYLKDGLIPGQDLNRTAWRMKGGFISWRKLSDEMRSGEYGRFRATCDDWFVVVDDIGAGHETPFITSKLDELFDARQGKWTVVTANLGLAQIQAIDTRIASRMIRNSSVVVDVAVPDYSLRRNAA